MDGEVLGSTEAKRIDGCASGKKGPVKEVICNGVREEKGIGIDADVNLGLVGSEAGSD